MKIAIDLDGTAWKHSKKFKAIIQALKFCGHEIGILTAHFPEDEQDDLMIWNATFYIPPDFYICMPKDRKMIGKFKAEMLIEHNIDVLFDDFGGNNLGIEQTFFEFITREKLIMKVIGDE